MGDLIRRLVWFFIVASAIAYAIFLAAGTVIRTQALEASHIANVRDSLEPGSHHLSGIVMLPSTCSELSVRTEQIAEAAFMLVFTTWEEPSIDCEHTDTPRPFHAVVFGPAAGVTFSATLDGEPLDVAVYPYIDQTN